MSWLTRLAGRKSEVLGPVAFNDIMSVMFPTKGQSPVTDARSAVDRSVWIMRAVATVATRIGSLPWHFYKGDKITDTEAYRLTRPSPNMTGTEWVERIIAWEILHGTGMVYVEKPSIKGITVLDSDMIRIDQGGNIQYREPGLNGQYTDRQLDKSNIVLFPNFSITGQLGLSELRPILDTANMDEGAKLVWNNQMGSGGLLAGLFSSEVRLSASELDAAKKSWEEKYGGVQRAGTIGFLGAGFKFQPLGISAADLKLLEVSKVTREEIGAAFGVPGIFLNDTQSVDYSNATTQERILYSNTVIPKADRLADRITTFLLPLLGIKGLTFRFDYTGIECLQANKLERAQLDKILLDSGVLTINEVCKRDGLKVKDWGDTWWASAMLVPISDSEIAPPPPPVALPATTPADVPVVPPEPTATPPQEPKGLKALHTPEARLLIAKAFISKVKPQEKKFAANTMKVFNKQAKVVEAWVADGQKAVAVKKVRDMLDDADFVENWHSLFVSFGMSAAEEVAARYSMNVPDGSAILKWIRAHETKQSTLVNNTTADEISQILADARANGASIPDMVKATKQYFDGIAYRAERVARTNVIACNNAAAQDVYVENGVKQHEWLSTHDERTRGESNGHPGDEFDHMAADAEVVGITEPFMSTGGPLMYPGDPDGDPANTINCRCTILPVV